MWLTLREIGSVFGLPLLLSFPTSVAAYVFLMGEAMEDGLPLRLSKRIWYGVFAHLCTAIAVVLTFTYFVWGPLWLVSLIGAAVGGYIAYLQGWMGLSLHQTLAFRIANLYALTAALTIWILLELLVHA